MKRYFFLFIISIVSSSVFSQSNLQTLLKSGEIIVTGLSILKANKNNATTNNTTLVESVCVKNKLQESVTFKLVGKDEKDNEVKKELVIPQGGKECTFNLTKGVWAYEVVLPNKEIYKKGEYKLEDEIVITVE